MTDDSDNKDTAFQMRVNQAWLKKIDAWRVKEWPIPSRAEAVRVLVEAGIKALKKG